MKKARNQIKIGREPLSHYVIRSENLSELAVCFFCNMQYRFIDL